MSATIYCEFVTQSNANDSRASLDLIGLADTVALGTPDEILAQVTVNISSNATASSDGPGASCGPPPAGF